MALVGTTIILQMGPSLSNFGDRLQNPDYSPKQGSVEGQNKKLLLVCGSQRSVAVKSEDNRT